MSAARLYWPPMSRESLLSLDSFPKQLKTGDGKGRRSMVRFEQIGMSDHLAQDAGRNSRFPVSSKTKAKTTTKTV
jgi:hypothetical protein